MDGEPQFKPDLKKPLLKRSALGLAALALSATVGLTVDHVTAPYNPILGGPNRSESAIGTKLLEKTAELQQDHTEKTGNPKGGIYDLVHLAPRLWHSGNIPHYLKEFFGDRYTSGLPSSAEFSEAVQESESPVIPTWIDTKRFDIQSYEAANGDHIDTLTFNLKDAKPHHLIPWQRTGTLTAPNIYLADPNPLSRSDNTYALGSNPYTAHSNGAAIELTLPNNQTVVFGAGWHEVSPLYRYADKVEAEKTTQYYGRIDPNNDAQAATGIYSIQNGSVTTHHEYVGHLDSADYPPQFLYIGNGTARILKGAQLTDILENPPYDGTVTQIAYTVEYSDEELELINDAMYSSEGVKMQKLDTLQKGLADDLTQPIDVTWMTVAITEDGDTIVSFALNRDTEAETIEGSYKVVASVKDIIESTKKQPGSDLTRMFTVHLGAQGSTGNVIITNGQSSIPEGVITYETMQELISDKQRD